MFWWAQQNKNILFLVMWLSFISYIYMHNIFQMCHAVHFYKVLFLFMSGHPTCIYGGGGRGRGVCAVAVVLVYMVKFSAWEFWFRPLRHASTGAVPTIPRGADTESDRRWGVLPLQRQLTGLGVQQLEPTLGQRPPQLLQAGECQQQWCSWVPSFL